MHEIIRAPGEEYVSTPAIVEACEQQEDEESKEEALVKLFDIVSVTSWLVCNHCDGVLRASF